MEAPRVSKRKRTVLTLETDSFYSGNGQFLLLTLEKKLEVLKELDKGLSQRLVGER